MTSLREFLDQREAELLAEIDGIRRSLQPLESELGDVRRAKSVIAGQAPVEYRSPPSAMDEFDAVPEVPSGPYARLTMKELTVKALRERFPHGASAQTLLQFFQQAWERSDVRRSSLSPQLTRLKDERIIYRVGKIWHLVSDEKGPDEPSEPDPSVGDVAERPIAPDLESGGPSSSKNTMGPGGSNPSVSAPFHRVLDDLLAGTAIPGASANLYQPNGQKGG